MMLSQMAEKNDTTLTYEPFGIFFGERPVPAVLAHVYLKRPLSEKYRTQSIISPFGPLGQIASNENGRQVVLLNDEGSVHRFILDLNKTNHVVRVQSVHVQWPQHAKSTSSEVRFDSTDSARKRVSMLAG